MKKIFRKLKSFVILVKGRRWGVIWDRFPFVQKLLSLTNYFPHPQNYRYILLGGHGLGMTALFYYLKQIGAKPDEIWWYELIRPFIFYRKFDGMVLDKSPLNIDAPKILQKLKKKVPAYQLIRDPISIIKSNVNVTIFHLISSVNSQEDADKRLIEVIEQISHLMFHFASIRRLVHHIVTDITYLKMSDIDEKGMPITLQKIAQRFEYNSYEQWGGGQQNESVIKGSLFPRCFPHIFKIQNQTFILSTHSRLNASSVKEVDMSSNNHIVRDKLNGSYNIVEDNILVQGHEQYPLILATLGSSQNHCEEQILTKAKNAVDSYINYAILAIQKHQQFIFDEDKVIDTLRRNKDFSLKLAHKIHSELHYIRQEAPEFLKDFIHTEKFLKIFGIDIHSNSTTKDIQQ